LTYNDDGRNRSYAYVLLRVMLGVNMAVHGISRILAGPGTFAATLVHGFQSTPLPAILVRAFGLALPWAEAAIGLLILLGLFRLPALLAGGAMLVALTFGSTLRQDWESAGLQLIYALVYAALLAFLGYDRFALDLVLWRPTRRDR
jgi:thiosulfate dehydrogenase (quinone) large subunit